MNIKNLELKNLVVDKTNPRKDNSDINELADSLANGQEVPLKVEDLEDGKYLVIDGHRRYSAFQILKKRTGKDQMVGCLIEKSMTPEERLLKRCIIDAQSKNWSMVERDSAWRQLWNIHSAKGVIKSDFAKLLGATAWQVDSFFDRAKISADIKKTVGESVISETRGVEPVLREKLLKKAQKEGTGHREMRQIVSAIRTSSPAVQDATCEGIINVAQANKLKGLSEDKQKVAIANMAALKKHMDKVPKLVENDKAKPRNEEERRKVTAQMFFNKLSSTVADTASNMRIIDSALESIDEQDLYEAFKEQHKKALLGMIEEFQEDSKVCLERIKKTMKKWEV